MPEVWAAEELVDAERARRVIRAQFAGQVAADDVTLISEGFDYAVFRVDQEWAFRFPRREVGVPGTELEIEVLPELAARLPVPVPAPVFVGAASAEFRWPFYGARYLDGVEAAGQPVDPVALAAALRVLHAPALLDALGDRLPVDPLARVDMDVRVPRVAAYGVDAPALFAAAHTLPPPRHTAVCHGDLHMRQILVDGGTLTGIVDWVDVCRSDPAVDLSVAWTVLTAEERAAFFAAYGEVEEETRIRARVVAAFLCAAVADWAAKERIPLVLDAASAGLRRAIEEP